MKKILSIVLILSFVLSFVGCKNKNTQENIKNIIDSAFKKNSELKDISIVSEQTVLTRIGDSDSKSVYTIELKEKDIGDKDKYEMSSSTVAKVNDQIASSYDTYYKDGYFYTTQYDGNFKKKTDVKDMNVQSEILSEIQVEDMKSIEIEADKDGEITVSFSCKTSAIGKELNVENLDDITINESQGQYVINADGYISNYELSISTETMMDGDAVITKTTKSIDYEEIGEEINPYDPEDEYYMEVENLKDLAALNGAMLSTAAATNIGMDMEIEAQIILEDFETSYKREYKRVLQNDKKLFMQKYETDYFEDGKKSNSAVNSQYYKDGIYQTENSAKSSYYYVELEYPAFINTAFTDLSSTPMDMHSTGLIKEISCKEKNGEKIFTYSLNPKAQKTDSFIAYLFGPYNNFNSFGGNITESEKVVHSFEGKSYLDKDGKYYKTEMSCDITVKFEEGDVRVKAKQTLLVDTEKTDYEINPPSIKDYNKMDTNDFIKSYYQ